MSSFRQIEANRRNARLSTGPVTEEGKKISRQNAVRHGLTAETVITVLEDAEDYAAFEMAVTADYDPQTAVERELVLRLANLLWRLRRATSIETGLFEARARHLLQFRKPAQTHRNRCQDTEDGAQDLLGTHDDLQQYRDSAVGDEDDLTRSFIQLNDLATSPLDRLSRYEAALWKQTCQILFTLQCLTRRKPWRALNRL
jgi:hypothetical protein